MRLLFALFGFALASAAAKPVNLVFILTDNQGAWTLGCYGNPDIRTPHIDRMAAEGIRFTRALSSNPVCSPTRATFLTGLIPSQHGVHSFLDPKYMMGPEAYNTLQEFTSLGEVLHDAGYTCGLSGKWHLGANITPSEGFTTWTTKPDGSTQEFYDQKVIENGQLRVEAGYTTDLWTRKGIEFIEQNKERPFFLYLAYNGPYSLGKLMTQPARNRHAEYYADKPLQSFPRDAMHPWQHANKQFHNTDAGRRRMAAECSGVDDGVGEILAALQANGLDENTLVVYSSDQGWMGGQNGMWGMGDHFVPTGAHELMMQIPLIFRHLGQIDAAQTCDAIVSNYDFMPSVLAYLGQAMPKSPKSPGRDFSPAPKLGQHDLLRNGDHASDPQRALEICLTTSERTFRTLRHAGRSTGTLQSIWPAGNRFDSSRSREAARCFLQPIRRPQMGHLERRRLKSEAAHEVTCHFTSHRDTERLWECSADAGC